jgi:hypothetical protein
LASIAVPDESFQSEINSKASNTKSNNSTKSCTAL